MEKISAKALLSGVGGMWFLFVWRTLVGGLSVDVMERISLEYGAFPRACVRMCVHFPIKL